jgi:hypothetical protein
MPRQRDAAEMMTLGNMGASQRTVLFDDFHSQSSYGGR